MNQMQDNIDMRLNSSDWSLQISKKVLQNKKKARFRKTIVFCFVFSCLCSGHLIYELCKTPDTNAYVQLSDYLSESEPYDYDVIDLLK